MAAYNRMNMITERPKTQIPNFKSQEKKQELGPLTPGKT
jgi:hypothetical protein